MSSFAPGHLAQTVNPQQSVLFYDASSAAIAELVRHSHVKTVGLTASAEPLKAISRQLDGRRVAQLHIVAHGQRDFIVIGDAVITSDYLVNHADLLNTWQVDEIMLWSCHVGTQGKLVETLALLTGATVHATDKPLGMTAAGPNWTLGTAPGAVTLPFAADAALQWPHQLVGLLFSAKAYLAEDSSGASGANKANLEENSLKLTAFANATAVKYLFVSQPPGDPIYTGNNVHGTLYAIDANNNVVQSWVGEISRLVKSGSNVQAAQMYVYPTGTNTSNPATTLLIDLGTGGSFAVGKTIGTSSDPVDTALNKLIPTAAAPVAYADNGDLQLASCVNDGEVAQSANPTGNLITGGSDSGSASTPDSGYITSWSIDTTPNPDKLVASVSGLAVSNVKSNATGGLAAVTSAASSTVQGKYGVLTINADGSYSYDVNESNPDLIALSSASGSSLNEVFTYTVTQAGTGKTSTSTLTIRIDGGNDDPTAGNDYVFVNEGTDARPVTLASTTTTPGAVTAANLLANDRDPDTADTLHIVKAEKATSLTDETFSGSAVTVTSSGVSSFTRTIGFTYVTVQFGTTVSETLSSEVYVKRAGELTFTDSGTTLTAIGGSPAKQATFSAGLDLAVGDVIRFGSASATNEYTIASGGLITASHTRFKLTGTGSTPSVGTDVTGPGVPADTKISAVSGSLVTLDHSVTLTGSGLDIGESLSFFSGAVYGNYGYLNLKSDGSYSYVLTADVPNGTTKDEFFTYQIADSNGCTDTAVLHVRIEGDQVTFPMVTAKTLTVDEVGAVSGSLAPVSGTTISLDGEMDEFVSTVLSTHASSDVVVVGTSAIASPSEPVQGKYGVLHVSALGEWSYTLNNDNATVDALRTTADTLTETFEYRVQNYLGDDNVSTIVITIRGANDAPVAANDSGSAIEAGGQANATAGADASGALFVNDTDVDSGDSKTLQGFGVSSIGALGSANGNGEYTLTGSHGTLYVKADGTWRYVVDNSDTAVDALGTGDTLTDTFQYRVADTAGATDDATLQVTIKGANDTVAVNDVEVNEASSHAVFTITGSAGQEVTLHLAQTGAGVEEATIGETWDVGALLTTGLEYYNGSQWVPYNSTSDKVTLDENGTLYVRTAIHDDDDHEGQESFQLYVTTTDGHSSVGTGVIVDEGNGVKVVFDPETGLPSTTTDGLDDDRAITVTGDTYNEGSPVAVFTVAATKGQSFTLDVQDAADTGKDATGDDGDLDADDGDASGDALDAADIYYSLDNGATWIKYTSGDSVTAGDYPVLVSVDISNEGDDVYEGEEQFKLIVSTPDKDSSGYSSIVDDGSGKIPALDGDGHPLVDNGTLTLDTETAKDDDRGITVTGDTYNEGSPVAVFKVEATKGQSFTLDVQDAADTGKDATGDDGDLDADDGDASGDALDAADIYYSLDNGVTWTKYTSGDSVTAGDYPVLVSVDISNEGDDVYEGEEQFKLIVSTPDKNYSGYSSIVDDGSGKILVVDGDGHPLVDNGNLTLDTETAKDDDRGIVVTGGSYNEASPRAVFSVTAAEGQSLTLDVRDIAGNGKDPTGPDAAPNDQDGDDTGDALDSAAIYYSLDGGQTWSLYTGEPVTAGAAPVLVAVDISNETDNVYEGEEQFQLVVTAGDKSYSGYASIVDDGTGNIAPAIVDGTDLGGSPYTGGDLGGAKDDDRPVEPPPPQEPFTADLDPATDTGEFDHITKNTEPEFTLDGGDYLQPGGSVQLVDSHGNVLDTALITADDIARGTINLAPGFLDDGVYTYMARILDANGQLLAEAPVNVTVVTDLDGVMPSVELAANGGDFNHDGVLDWLQNNVAQLPVSSYEAFAAGKSAPASSFGAIMVGNVPGSAPGSAVNLDAGAQLLDVHIDKPSKPLPEKYLAQTPLMDFTVRAAEGQQLTDIAPDRAGLQTRVVIDLQPGGAVANTYLKWDAAAQEYYEFLDDGDLSTYDDGATLIDLNGDKLIDRIVVTLTDGAHGDEDGVVNGVIVDPGLLAMKASTPVYSVLLKNGDRIYTTSAAEAAQMAKGTGNKFEGARFENQEGDGAKPMVAWYNPYTRDWFFGAEDQSPPYACYVRKSTLSGFAAAPAGTDGAEDFHLFVNKKGMTQLVTLEQAAELKLSALRYVDKGVAFTASTEDAYTFDPEGYLIANHGNASVQALVTTLAGKFSSTAAAGFVDAVEQHFLAQAQLVGLPHGDAASAADLNAIFGTHFSG